MIRRLSFLLLILVSAGAYAQQKIRIACVGNSITEGRNIEEGKRYPDDLQRLMGGGYEVRNYGIGGRTLLRHGDYPYWKEDRYLEVLAWNPDVVIIKLGTNDSKPQNWQYKDEFVPDYRDFIASFKRLASHPAIYICEPIPVFKDNFNIRESVVKKEIVPMIRKIAKSEKVKVIDLYNPMKGVGDHVPDGVHPDAQGAALMADLIYRKIR